MYSTVQELHIEIEQRIQQITSNRNGSIAPEFIDMVLNRNAIRYVNLKTNRKTNYKQEGFEDSKKRIDDLASLKKVTQWLDVYKDDDQKSFTFLPADYLSIVNSQSKYKYVKDNTADKWTGIESLSFYSGIFSIPNFIDNLNEYSTFTEVRFTLKDGGSPFIISYSKDSLENKDVFELASIFMESFNTIHSQLSCKWETFEGLYQPQSLILFTNNKNLNSFTYDFFKDDEQLNEDSLSMNWRNGKLNYNRYNINPDKISANDLVSSEKIPSLLQDFYACRNRHLNPITEIINDRFNVYHNNDFRVGNIKITYIKKPRLFDITRDQMSDLTITPEFMDMVVSDLLLILKDSSFNYVQQKTNLE